MGRPRKYIDISALPASRAEAVRLGFRQYMPSAPCKRGHVSPRYAGDNECMECNRLKVVRSLSRPEGREKLKITNKRYRSSDRGRAVRKRQKYRRRASVNASRPLQAEGFCIVEFVAACPPGFHVDHIIPLNGQLMCGLDVIYNLQYLPAQENILKSNKVDPLTLEANICVLPGFRTYTHTCYDENA